MKAIVLATILVCMNCGIDQIYKFQHTYYVSHVVVNNSHDTLFVSSMKDTTFKMLLPLSEKIEDLYLVFSGSDNPPSCYISRVDASDASDSIGINIRDTTNGLLTSYDTLYFLFDTLKYPINSKLPYNEDIDKELLYSDTFTITDSLIDLYRTGH
jgi:hypothetical protein